MSDMAPPRRDPTATAAIMNIMREEAKSHGMSLRRFLRALEDTDSDEGMRLAASRLRERITAI
jgi:hypothetical protein